MTVREMLTAQGFPVSADHTFGKACSSYALRWERFKTRIPSTPWPSHRACMEQIGNSMHTNCSGIMFLYALTQVIMDSGMMAAQVYSLRKNQRLAEDHVRANLNQAIKTDRMNRSSVPTSSAGHVSNATASSPKRQRQV